VGALDSNDWFKTVLAAVRAAEPPELWIGAGAVRDVIWDARFGHGFDPANVKDVDVVYFDPERDRDDEIQSRLETLPEVVWDVTNEATVHDWYEREFGVAVEPFESIEEAIATWPEFATSVAVRLDDLGAIEVIAPFGLDDLLDGVWRRNPTRVTLEEAQRRLARKKVAERWPGVRVA
jgi:hypothetical protein